MPSDLLLKLFHFDALSGIMMTLVSFIGLIVGLFAVRYMQGDSQYYKFFASLGLLVLSVSIMAASVTQESNGNMWKVRFIMPSSYTKETLPKPNNSAVKLIPTEGRRFVVIRFSGLTNEKNLQEHLHKLVDFVRTKKLKSISEPIYAFFNPPWTFPPLRRNEIMIEIKR